MEMKLSYKNQHIYERVHGITIAERMHGITMHTFTWDLLNFL